MAQVDVESAAAVEGPAVEVAVYGTSDPEEARAAVIAFAMAVLAAAGFQVALQEPTDARGSGRHAENPFGFGRLAHAGKLSR